MSTIIWKGADCRKSITAEHSFCDWLVFKTSWKIFQEQTIWSDTLTAICDDLNEIFHKSVEESASSRALTRDNRDENEVMWALYYHQLSGV